MKIPCPRCKATNEENDLQEGKYCGFCGYDLFSHIESEKKETEKMTYKPTPSQDQVFKAELKERFKTKSDEELERILREDREEYTEIALEVAEEELNNRRKKKADKVSSSKSKKVVNRNIAGTRARELMCPCCEKTIPFEIKVCDCGYSFGSDGAGGLNYEIEKQDFVGLTGPSLYQNNAFRILGIPSSASFLEIQTRFQEIDMRLKLGKKPSYEYDFPWFCEIDRSEESIRDALQRLEEPAKRFYEQLFWFNVLTPVDKEAMFYLTQGDSGTAFNIWYNAVNTRFEESLSYFHNLTILGHIGCIIEETQKKDSFSESHWKLWKDVIKNWVKIWKMYQFWDSKVSIFTASRDPQFVKAKTNKLRAMLPRLILSVTGELLGEARKENNETYLKEHTNLLLENDFPIVYKKQIIDLILLSDTKYLEAKVDEWSQRIKTVTSENIGAEILRKVCEDVHEDIRKKASQIISQIVLLDGRNISSCNIVRDSYCEMMRSLAIAFYKAENAQKSLSINKEAYKIAVSLIIKARIEKDIEIFEEITERERLLSKGYALDVRIKQGIMYYVTKLCCCCMKPTEDTESIPYSFEEHHIGYKNVHRGSMSLPICNGCKKHIGKENRRTTIWGFLIFASVISSFIVSGTWDIWLAFFPVLFMKIPFIAIMMNRFYKQEQLGSEHISTRRNVWIKNVDHNFITLHFENPSYGLLFARANKDNLISKDLTMRRSKSAIWATRNSKIILSVCSGIFFLILFFHNTNHYSISNEKSEVSNVVKPEVEVQRDIPSTKIKTEPQVNAHDKYSVPFKEHFAIKQQLDSWKVEIENYESELKEMTTKLENAKQEMETLKSKIEEIENKYKYQEMPSYVVSKYQGHIDEYNSKIVWARTAVERYKSLYEKYEIRRGEYNDLVKKYNNILMNR